MTKSESLNIALTDEINTVLVNQVIEPLMRSPVRIWATRSIMNKIELRWPSFVIQYEKAIKMPFMAEPGSFLVI